jgi:hypothetical protein
MKHDPFGVLGGSMAGAGHGAATVKPRSSVETDSIQSRSLIRTSTPGGCLRRFRNTLLSVNVTRANVNGLALDHSA